MFDAIEIYKLIKDHQPTRNQLIKLSGYSQARVGRLVRWLQGLGLIYTVGACNQYHYEIIGKEEA